SVPAILGGAAATDAATMLMPSPGGSPTQATTVLPSAAAAQAADETPEEPVEEKKRSPWTWPLIALIALLALVLIGTIIALVAQPSGTKPTATTTTSQTPTPKPTTPTPTPTANTAQITESEFLGKTADEARQMLQGLGMVADVQTGSPATSKDAVNTVYRVNPTGPVPKGSTVTVQVYGDVAAIPTPTDTVSANPASPQQLADPATQITVTFGSAGCPAGQNLVGRALYVNGAQQTPTSGNTTVWAPTAAGTYKLSYTIFCGESVESGQSPTVDYVISSSTPPAQGGTGGASGNG
ncbi:PASTA domain protein, partial [Leifsonia aquatica ATCC 14665]